MSHVKLGSFRSRNIGSGMKPRSHEHRKEHRTLHSLPTIKELRQLMTDSKPEEQARVQI